MESQHMDPAGTIVANEQQFISLMDEGAPGTAMLSLERFAYDREQGSVMVYDGDDGVRALLEGMCQIWPGGAILAEGHLVGVTGRLYTSSGTPLSVRVVLGPASQLITDIGFTSSATSVLEAIKAIDGQMHMVARGLGRDLAPLAQGYDPHLDNPSDVPLVPLSRHALIAAHLSRSGSISRDVMRATASCRFTVGTSFGELIDTLKLVTAIAPLLTFLTDNCLHMRGTSPQATFPMLRTHLLDRLYTPRERNIPHLFSPEFTIWDYLRWLEELRPIVFTPTGESSIPTGTMTCRDLMSERVLTRGEARSLLRSTHADTRIVHGGVELCCADSLPPRFACAYAALVRGMLGTREGRESLASGLMLDTFSDSDPIRARDALRADGWSAHVYGMKVDRLARGMLRAALAQTGNERDKELIGELAELWAAQATPRDLLISNWEFENGLQATAEE